MKFICVGYSKTGTKTMAKALRTLGFKVDDSFEHMDKRYFWNRIYVADPNDKVAQSPEIFKEIFKNVDACTDSPAYQFWEEILEAFPEAKVILVEREEDKWVSSVQGHFEVERKENLGGWVVQYLPRQLMQLLSYEIWIGQHMHRDLTLGGAVGVTAPFGPNRCNIMIAKKRYREHNAYVKMKCPKEKLLIWDFKQGWEPLCKFTGVEKIPNIPVPRENVKAQIVFDALKDNQYLVQEIRKFTVNAVIFVLLFGSFLGYTIYLYVEKFNNLFGEKENAGEL